MKRPALIDLGLLLALSLILRAALLGHPNLFIDEAFYTTVGAAMHQGALPYVDVWDRKPFGLFALYWLFTAFSPSPLGYQLAAIVFSGATGWVVSRIALLWTPRRAALSAGALYVLSLGLFQGFGGQSPVFYNLPMALAALLVLRSRQTLRATGPDRAARQWPDPRNADSQQPPRNFRTRRAPVHADPPRTDDLVDPGVP